MASTGAGTKVKQSNAISIIDAINAINLVNNSINLFMALPKNISFVANNPLMFILNLLNHIGITEEALKKREKLLNAMSNKEIDKLIASAGNTQAKIYFSKFKKQEELKWQKKREYGEQ